MSLSIDARFSRLYSNLHKVAHRAMGWGSPDGVIQPTSLLHEAYLKVHSHEPEKFKTDAQFATYLAATMRTILIDAARKHDRRDELLPRTQISVDELASKTQWRAIWILDFEEILDRMEAQDSHLYEIVILRVYLGLSISEIATQLNKKLRTTELHWKLAKQCLSRLHP